MRLHTNKDDVACYIGALARSISIDPGSLENWLCLHINVSDPASGTTVQLTKALWEGYSQTDCDVFCCEGQGEVFIISRQLPAAMLFHIAEDVIKCCGDMTATLRGYDLLQDWREVRGLLLEKTEAPTGFVSPHSHTPETYFGDMKALSNVFKESVRVREARTPLYIMVVEDDPMTRRIVCNTLKDHYAVIDVATAYDAVANYLLYAPDIVFLDIGLPDTTGFKVLQQITESDPDAYVIMFSGDGGLDNILGALNAGANGFITKPFNRDKIRHYVASAAQWRNKQVEA